MEADDKSTKSLNDQHPKMNLNMKSILTIAVATLLTAMASTPAPAQIELESGIVTINGDESDDRVIITPVGSYLKFDHFQNYVLIERRYIYADHVWRIHCNLDDGDNYYDNRSSVGDTISATGLRGTNTIWAGDGSSTVILSNDGPNLVFGGEGDDGIIGGSGSDWLLGEGGDDMILDSPINLFSDDDGDGVRDVLVGGTGNDRLFGEANFDLFFN